MGYITVGEEPTTVGLLFHVRCKMLETFTLSVYGEAGERAELLRGSELMPLAVLCDVM